MFTKFRFSNSSFVKIFVELLNLVFKCFNLLLKRRYLLVLAIDCSLVLADLFKQLVLLFMAFAVFKLVLLDEFVDETLVVFEQSFNFFLDRKSTRLNSSHRT